LLLEGGRMCENNTCGACGKNGDCAPACGTLEGCGERVKGYSRGILPQTVGEIEVWVGFAGMTEAEKKHKATIDRFVGRVRNQEPDALPVGTGGCRICAQCTYPDEPCRFPEKSFTSMEAYGMEVNRICKNNGLSYNYGPGKIAYTACCFLP